MFFSQTLALLAWFRTCRSEDADCAPAGLKVKTNLLVIEWETRTWKHWCQIRPQVLRKQLRGRKWRICVFEKWPGLQILEATRTSQVFPCFHLRLGHLYTVYICIQVRPNCQLSRHSPYLSLTRYLERVIAMCFTSFRDAKFLSLPLPPKRKRRVSSGNPHEFPFFCTPNAGHLSLGVPVACDRILLDILPKLFSCQFTKVLAKFWPVCARRWLDSRLDSGQGLACIVHS